MQQTVYFYAVTIFKQYFSLLHFLIYAACGATQNNTQNEPGNSTQSSHITISKADPNTAYLGKWQLLKLDGAPFVATPVLQRKQPNNPAAMSPVAASASIQFSSAPMVTSVPQPGATDCLAAKSGSVQISNLAPSDPPEWDAPRQPNRYLPAL